MTDFQIMHGKRKSIPWAMIEPHEKQAKINHYQTLQRLSERGGLSPLEAICVLEDRDFPVSYETEVSGAEKRLEELVRKWEMRA